jgi:glycosyltransferase involved in cell wall biosynthesis
MRKMVANSTIKVMRIIARMNVGGPAIQITTMLNGLPENVIDQRLYFGACAPGEAEYISDIRAQDRLRRIPGFSRNIALKRELSVLLYLMRAIRSEKPDIIHTHTAKAGFLGRLAAILTLNNAKRVHTFHGHVLTGYFSPLVSRIYGQVERFFARHTDVIISVGDQVRNELQKWKIGSTNKHRVIYPGIPIGEKIEKSQARSDLGISQTHLTFAFIGRITPIKRVDRIIEVARLCKKNELDIQFILAGEGSDFSYFKNIVEKESLPIIFLGWRSDVERILSAADALILTSDNEGTPIASIQGSLLGVPTIATNVGSLSDIVISGKTGILTSTSAEDIYQAIVKIYERPEVLAQMGKEAEIYAHEKFSVARFLKEYEDLYCSLVS